MSSKFSKRFLWLLMIAAFAVVAAGGCGGGSSSGGSDPSDSPVDPTPTPSDSPYRPPLTESLSLGLDTNGVPALFRLLDRNADERVITPGEKVDIIGTEPEAVALEVPAQVKSVLRAPVLSDTVSALADDPDAETPDSVLLTDCDIFSVELNSGVKYSVEVSNNLADSIGFVPLIEITNEKGEPVTDYELTVEPREDPAVIVKTFTPKSDDRFLIRVASSGHSSGNTDEIHYLLRVYAENGQNGESGHPTQFMVGKKPVSLRDVIMLRRATMGSSDQEKNAFGFPKLTISGPRASAFGERLREVNLLMAEVGTGSDKSKIDPTVANVPWMDGMNNGAGYFATTGKKAVGVPVKNFTLPQSMTSPKETFDSHFISTKEEHEKEMNIKGSASYSSAVFSLGASASYSNKIRYSLETTTLVVHYDVQDTEYQILDSINDYKLTEEARAYFITHGAEKFRERYGDYFLSGRRMGARIDAYIIVKTKNSEKIRTIKEELNGKYASFGASQSFEQTMKDTLKETDVTVHIETLGGPSVSAAAEPRLMYMDTDGTFKDHPVDAADFEAPVVRVKESHIDNVMSTITNFVNAYRGTPTFKLATLDVRLDAISSLDPLIPTTIPVAPDCFALSHQLMRELFGLTSFYNDVASIPNENLYSPMSIKSEWENKYKNFVDKLNANLDEICSSVDELNKAIAEVQALSSEFRDISDRWVFYRKMIDWRNEDYHFKKTDVTASPDWPNDVLGYLEFPLSATVDNDIRSAHKYEDTWSGDGYVTRDVRDPYYRYTSFDINEPCPEHHVWVGMKMSGKWEKQQDWHSLPLIRIHRIDSVTERQPFLYSGLPLDAEVRSHGAYKYPQNDGRWEGTLVCQAVDLSNYQVFVGLQQ